MPTNTKTQPPPGGKPQVSLNDFDKRRYRKFVAENCRNRGKRDRAYRPSVLDEEVTRGLPSRREIILGGPSSRTLQRVGRSVAATHATSALTLALRLPLQFGPRPPRDLSVGLSMAPVASRTWTTVQPSYIQDIRGHSGIGRWRLGDCAWRLSCDQIFAHFFQPLRADAANRQQIVDALEWPIRLAHLQDFSGGRRPDSRDLLQLLGIGGIDVDRMGRRFLRRCMQGGDEQKRRHHQ
jgi:hypothetical protein